MLIREVGIHQHQQQDGSVPSCRQHKGSAVERGMQDSRVSALPALHLVKGDDRVEVAIAITQEIGRLGRDGQLRARPRTHEEPRL
jgi:hypothetical protein